MAKKNHLSQVMKQQKLQAFRAAMDSLMMIMTVALNDEFGFGRDRLLRLEKRFNDLYTEYGCLVAEDISYGNAKLTARVEQIMKAGAE